MFLVNFLQLLLISSSKSYSDISFQSDKDYDPFADRRRPTIADREDEYRQKRRRMIISPERIDPFADGEYFFHFPC